MRFIFALFVFLSLSLSGCFIEEPDNRRLNGRSDKAKPGDRTAPEPPPIQAQPAAPAQQNRAEAPAPLPFSLPIFANAEHQSLTIAPADEGHQKMSIAAAPSKIPLNVLAGFQGSLSLSESVDSKYHILSVQSGHRTMYTQLLKKKTELLLSEGAAVEAKSITAATTGPVIFYLRENKDLRILCINVQEGPGNFIIKNFQNHPSCGRR